jgi:hypothetical protein
MHNLTTSYITHETGPSHLNTGFSIALESSRGTAIAYLPSPGKPTRSKRKTRWSEVELALQQSGSQDREPKSEGCAEKVALLSSNGLTTHRTADARVFYKRASYLSSPSVSYRYDFLMEDEIEKRWNIHCARVT